GHDDRCTQSRPNDAAPQLASNKELHVALLLLSRATSNRLRSASTATGTHRQTAPGLNLRSNSYHSVLSDTPLAGRASTSPCSGMSVKSWQRPASASAPQPDNASVFVRLICAAPPSQFVENIRTPMRTSFPSPPTLGAASN